MNQGIIRNGDESEEGICLITGKPYRAAKFHESMSRVTCRQTGAVIRVWRTHREFVEYPDEEVLAIFGSIPGGASIPDLVRIIGSIEGVTAVEVTDSSGLGNVSYFEWP